VDAARNLTAFSSVGPTDDGRIKPDIMADGMNIFSTVPNLVIDENGDGVDDFAGPHGIMSGGLAFFGGKGRLTRKRREFRK
jgi:hypothetical protein